MSIQLYHRFLEYAFPQWRLFILAFFSMAATALILIVQPAVIQQLIDHLIIYKNNEMIQQLLLIMVILLVAYSVMFFISTHAVNSLCSKTITNLRITMFNKFLSLPNYYYTTLNNQNSAAILNSDLNQLNQICCKITSVLVKDSLTILGILAWMFHLNQELTLLTLLIATLILIVLQLLNGFLQHANSDYNQKVNIIDNQLDNITDHHKTICLYNSQSQEYERLISNIEKMQQAYKKKITKHGLRFLVIQLLAIILCVTVGYLVIQQVNNNVTTPGTAASFLLSILILMISLKKTTSINGEIKQSHQLLVKFFSFIDLDEKASTGTDTIQRATGELTFDQVCFYNEKQTLPLIENFSLTINSGEIVALMNTPENFKAALIDLTLGLRKLSNGKILLDGENLENLKPDCLYNNIALLTDKITIFEDTVAANIAYGSTRCANEAKITAAAQASSAMTFIREMPQGLQTIVGDQGVELTKKQRQHISIARILLKNAPILILDNIPALFDTDSNELQNAIQQLLTNRTTLAFCHHASILNLTNRFYTLKNGAPIEIAKTTILE